MAHRFARLPVVLLGSLLLAPEAWAQPAAMVEDLRAGNNAPFSFGSFWASRLGGETYFSFDDGVHGAELWRADGTPSGTELFFDVCPGFCAGLGAGQIVTVAGSVFFVADDGTHGRELWVTDGTVAGTHIVLDLAPGLRNSDPSWLTEFNGALLFTASLSADTRSLLRTDGTPAGTVEVSRFSDTLGAAISELLVSSAGLFFFADDGLHGAEPWISDGTVAGTHLVTDIAPGSAASVYGQPWEFPRRSGAPALLGARILFPAWTSAGLELWRTDGTAAGTQAVADIAPGAADSAPRDLVNFAGRVFFSAFDGVSRGLWSTDGTSAGTAQIPLNGPSGPGASPSALTVVGTRLFFFASTAAEGSEIWSSDGTAAGAALVTDLNPGPADAFAPFVAPYLSPGAGWGVAEGRFFAWGTDGTGRTPWVSDGTAAGTVSLLPHNEQVLPGLYSLPIETLGGAAFVAFEHQGTDETAMRVWATDGTPLGTAPILDQQTPSSSWDQFLAFGLINLSSAGDRLFFAPHDDSGDYRIWNSDGSAAGSVPILDLGPRATTYTQLFGWRSKVLFLQSDGVHGREPWVSDGASASMLADTNPSGDGELSAPQEGGGALYFLSAAELWRTDGSPSGTAAVDSGAIDALVPLEQGVAYSRQEASGCALLRADSSGVSAIVPPLPGAQCTDLRSDGHRLFFILNTNDLWFSDGTVAGTHDVLSLPAAESFVWTFSTPQAYGALRAVLHGRAFFVVDDPTTGPELWTSDGTAAGTHLVKDIHPGTTGASPQWLTAAGDGIFFTADDGVHGRELWWSDGSDTGTRMVKDIVPGAGSGLPQELAFVDSVLLFSAHDATAGREMWASNGSEAGTVRIQDIDPGPEPSSPMSFTVAGPNVFFYANDGVHGFELWALPRAALADAVSAALDFYTVPPCRVLDTRSEGGAIAGGVERVLDVAGRCGIPNSARAVAVNVTAVDPTAMGFLALGAGNQSIPGTSVVNFAMGRTRAASTMLRLGTDGSGKAKVKAALNARGTVHVVLDVAGWFE